MNKLFSSVGQYDATYSFIREHGMFCFSVLSHAFNVSGFRHDGDVLPTEESQSGLCHALDMCTDRFKRKQKISLYGHHYVFNKATPAVISAIPMSWT